jgi:Cu-processing system permease protein
MLESLDSRPGARSSRFESQEAGVQTGNVGLLGRKPGVGVDRLQPLATQTLHPSTKPTPAKQKARFPIFEFRDSSFKTRILGSAHRVAAIALHNFKESVRDRVLYNLVLFALLLIGAAILFGSISVGIERTILVNLGLSSISIFGLLIAIFIGIGLVAKEIDKRTIHPILSKPVGRAEFILGKYFGLLLTLAINTAVMTAGFYLALIYQEHGLDRADLAALQAIYLILLQLALVVALALLFSCISTPVLSAVFTFCLFVTGHFLADLRWLGHQSGSAPLEKILNAVYYLLPDFGAFSVIGQAAHGQWVPGYLLAADSLYALLYATVLLSAAVLVFEEREFR